MLTYSNLIVAVATILVVLSVVTLHYEGLSLYTRTIQRARHRGRRTILVLVLGLIFIHVVAIWLFGFVYYALLKDPTLGTLGHAGPNLLEDCVYFSAVVYSTLGFGDLVPYGSIRLLAGTEALVGLSLITWSASFTFLEMQRYWRS